MPTVNSKQTRSNDAFLDDELVELTRATGAATGAATATALLSSCGQVNFYDFVDFMMGSMDVMKGSFAIESTPINFVL